MFVCEIHTVVSLLFGGSYLDLPGSVWFGMPIANYGVVTNEPEYLMDEESSGPQARNAEGTVPCTTAPASPRPAGAQTGRRGAGRAPAPSRVDLKSPVIHTNPPLIVWDHSLIVVRFDRAFEETTGWSKEEVLGKKIDLLLPEISKKESLDRINIATKNENSTILEIPILHANGNTSTVHGHYITARKQVKQDVSILDGKLEKRILERTASLEAVNRQLEAFSYSISHALLTPLQNIEKLCDTLREKDEEEMDNAEKVYLEQIYKETTRMGQLISDMRKLSHLNRSEISRQSVDVSKIVREIMEDFKQKYPEREVSITIEKDVIIGCDELLLKIALESLIDNAWKFTASKERAIIKFGTTLQDIKPVLFIRDNGIGFDLAQAHKLFSTFNRVDTRTGLPVTGLGLAKVQRIVDRHGGEIWAASKPGKGTTFYFTLSS